MIQRGLSVKVWKPAVAWAISKSRFAEDEQQDEVERRQHPGLPPASEANEAQQEPVDDDAADQELPPGKHGDEHGREVEGLTGG